MEGNRDEIEMFPHSTFTPHTQHTPPNLILTGTGNLILVDSPNPVQVIVLLLLPLDVFKEGQKYLAD